MNHEEILNDNVSSETYHATSNLNTAMENPQMAVGNTMGVNLDNVTTSFTDTSSNLNNNPINNVNLSQQNESSSFINVSNQEVSTPVTNSFIPKNVFRGSGWIL